MFAPLKETVSKTHWGMLSRAWSELNGFEIAVSSDMLLRCSVLIADPWGSELDRVMPC